MIIYFLSIINLHFSKNSENTSIGLISIHSWELAAGEVSFFGVYDQITGPLVIPQKLADFSINFVEVVLAVRSHTASLLANTLAGNTGICLDDLSLVVAITIFHARTCLWLAWCTVCQYWKCWPTFINAL